MSLPLFKPEIELLPYQRDGVAFLLDKKYAYLADEPGLGKTIQAIKAACEIGAPTLVICPAYLIKNWELEIEKFSNARHLFTVISYGTTSLRNKGFRTVILDESQYIKTIDSGRTVRVHNMVDTVRPDHLFLLSGSPIKNRVPELYSPLSLLLEPFIKTFPTFGSFCSSFCFEKERRFGNRRETIWEGCKDPERLRRILRRCVLRRRADEVLLLPPINQKKVYVDYGHDNALKKAWEDFNNSTGSRKDITAKAKSAAAKSAFTSQYVIDLLHSGASPIVVFSDHVAPVQHITGEIENAGFRVVGITSDDIPAAKRQHYIAKLQSGELDCIVATIGCLGTGGTLTRANHMVFNDIPWVPEDLKQAAKRIHRIGQSKTCFYHFVIGSQIDEYITDVVTDKQNLINSIMDEL